jgi:hypothetical protein
MGGNLKLTRMRSLLISVALLLTVSVAGTPVGVASPQTTVFVDPPTIGSGLTIDSEFQIRVNISGGFDIKTFSFKLRWYGAILECLSVVEGDFLKKEGGDTFFTHFIYNGPDPVGDPDYTIPGNSLLGVGRGVDGDGSLCVVTFKVEADGQSGLHLYEMLVLDSTGVEVPDLVVEDGTFDNEGWVARGEPGDVDGDHDVDIVDLMIIARAMGTNSNWPSGTDWGQWNPEADLNGDSAVDIRDLFIAAVNFGQPS